MSIFEKMTNDEAVEYCYKHEKQYVYENDQRAFDCLVEILDGTIKPKELPDYGMNYEEEK